MKQNILLIGPCPPPDGGTTIPFRLFYRYAIEKQGADSSIYVLNSNTGDKSLTSLFAPMMLLRVTWVTLKILIRSFKSDKIVIFGSQRFITLIGALVITLMRPFGKSVYLRINGGGYDIYFQTAAPIIRFVIHRVLSRARQIVVETNLVKSKMVDTWGPIVSSAPNYRATVIQKGEARTFSTRKVSFIYTGFIRQTKGCGELLDAFVQLERRLGEYGSSIKIQLDLFGSILDSPAEPLDIEPYRNYSNITIHGSVSNEALQEHYSRADVFVFPSYWPTEGHSGSIVEAMMHGLPIIATDWRAMGEVVNPGVSGLLCKPRDAADLGDKMFEICTDVQLRKKLSCGALRESVRFHEKVVCARLSELFALQ